MVMGGTMAKFRRLDEGVSSLEQDELAAHSICFASCPDVFRASARFHPARCLTVPMDGRVEPGHDGEGGG
ncbi:hypothetical protein A6A04_04410 [Paramagnetospirillum marisnigri]|uniref:Uncharacterized protein n=2 Tax=Paramagnetospirillum marisnigri TaxID=1285242 RepID=A0A178MIK9_9PROT|nr:hypothetical protein A6A04_04410 [Paramagnetospirillum marisnigri]